MIDSLSSLRNQAIELFGLFLAGRGVKQLVSDLTVADAALGRTARNIGVSASVLSKWQTATYLAGGSAEDATRAFQHWASTMEDLKSGFDPGEIRKWFGAIEKDAGVKLSGITQQPIEQQFIRLSDALNKVAAAHGRARALMFAQKLGLESLFNTIAGGSAATQHMLDQAQKLSVASQKDTEAAEDRQNVWRSLLITFDGFARTILTAVTPALVQLGRKFQDWLILNREWIQTGIVEAIERFVKYLKELDWTAIGNGIKSFVTGSKELADSLGGVVNITKALFALWAASKLLRFVNLLRLAFLGLGGAISGIGPALAGLGGIVAPWLLRFLGPLGILLSSTKSTAGREDDEPLSREYQEKHGSAARPSSKGEIQTHEDIAYFMNKGWSREAATGLAANIQAESGGDHRSVGDGGSAYGLAQWHPDRQKNFFDQYGKRMQDATREEQLAFIDFELRKGKEQAAGRALENAKSAEEAAALISKMYERPADREGQASARAAMARAIRARSPRLPDGADAGAATGAAAQDNSRSITSTSEVNVGTVNVHGVDQNSAQGVAKGIRPAIAEHVSFVNQSNYGIA